MDKGTGKYSGCYYQYNDGCHFACVQIHITDDTRENPNVNHRLRVIIMCQCRVIHCNKHTAVVGNTDNGGAVSGEEYEKSLYLSLNFALNLKLRYKKS